MKSLFWVFGALSMVSAYGADSASDPVLEAATILTKQCAGCHNKTSHPGKSFLEKANLTDPELAARMIRMIETSQMPPEHKAFRSSADGKKVLAFLRSQLNSKGKTDK